MYNAKYLYADGGKLDDIYKPAVCELYTKIHDRLAPWRIFRLVTNKTATDQMFHIIIGPNFGVRAEKTTNEKDFRLTYEFGPDYRNKLPVSVRWNCDIATVDTYVEDIMTMVQWYEPKYTEFMKTYKRDKARDELMQKINLEVEYHPDSPTVQLLNDHFDQLSE